MHTVSAQYVFIHYDSFWSGNEHQALFNRVPTVASDSDSDIPKHSPSGTATMPQSKYTKIPFFPPIPVFDVNIS